MRGTRTLRRSSCDRFAYVQSENVTCGLNAQQFVTVVLYHGLREFKLTLYIIFRLFCFLLGRYEAGLNWAGSRLLLRGTALLRPRATWEDFNAEARRRQKYLFYIGSAPCGPPTAHQEVSKRKPPGGNLGVPWRPRLGGSGPWMGLRRLPGDTGSPYVGPQWSSGWPYVFG